jgi:hypothetical protein
MVISVGTPQVDDILLTSEAARMPSETRGWVLAQTQACAPLGEGIVNVKAIDPAHGAGLETITRVAAVAIANGDRNHPILGASALGSDDDQLD